MSSPRLAVASPTMVTVGPEARRQASSRGAPLFAYEAELVLRLMSLLPSLLPTHTVVATEVVAKLGIADVVAARPRAADLERRLQSGLQPILVPGAIQLLEALDADLTTTQVMNRCGLTPSYGRRLIRELRQTGHIAGDDPWVRADSIATVFDSFIAIEAKLTDWRRAVAQAVRYRTFAHLSYIALPQTTRSSVDEDWIAASGIGLIYVGDTEAQIAIEASPSCMVESWRRLLVSETLVATGMRPASSYSLASDPRPALQPLRAVVPRVH